MSERSISPYSSSSSKSSLSLSSSQFSSSSLLKNHATRTPLLHAPRVGPSWSYSNIVSGGSLDVFKQQGLPAARAPLLAGPGIYAVQSTASREPDHTRCCAVVNVAIKKDLSFSFCMTPVPVYNGIIVKDSQRLRCLTVGIPTLTYYCTVF